jgi:hypothetical protein
LLVQRESSCDDAVTEYVLLVVHPHVAARLLGCVKDIAQVTLRGQHALIRLAVVASELAAHKLLSSQKIANAVEELLAR